MFGHSGWSMEYFYSPSPEYLAACREDEGQGEPFRSSKSEGGLASEEFRYRTAYGAVLHLFILYLSALIVTGKGSLSFLK